MVPINKTLLFLLLFSFSFLGFIQAQTISGQLVDEKNDPLWNANVLLLSPKDSSMLKGAITSQQGYFSIENVALGSYLLKFRLMGYQEIIQPLELKSSLNLKKITLPTASVLLKEVEISTAAVAVVQKEDTSEYNAAAYKVNVDATTEDLIKKMPGIVIQDGKIEAQGTEVKKILVDGKPFFGSDPNAAIKNLPAEAVERIQVYDGKSDQAAFTGFDDADLSKAINIITKLPYRNGAFGKVFLGGGYPDKWKAGGIANIFKGDKRISILLNSNNINEQNFSVDDIVGAMGSNTSGGGGGQNFRQRGGGIGSFMVDPKSGINTTNSLGINYYEKFKKVEFTGSYFFNYTKNVASTTTNRTYVTPNLSGLTYNAKSETESTNMNHRLNFKIDYTIDSSNSILFQPTFTFQDLSGNSTSTEQNLFQGIPTSLSETDRTSDKWAYNFSLPILYRHSFSKKGRTFSLELTPSYNQSKNFDEQKYLTSLDSLISVFDTTNQEISQQRGGFTMAGNATYTEPLSKKLALMLTYKASYTESNTDKKAYDFDRATHSYSLLDSTLSNIFKNNYMSTSGEVSLRYKEEKWELRPGVSLQYSKLSNNQTFPSEYSLDKPFTNVLPYVRFQYNYSKSKTLRINYFSSTREPSVEQLQEVLNNSNPLQLSIGNSNLKQSFQNRLFMRYSSSNPKKSTNMFFSLSGNYTGNYIGKSTFIARNDTIINGIALQPSAQLTTYQNFDKYYSVNAFFNYGIPIKPLKTNFNVTANAGYSGTPAIINNAYNFSNNTNAGLGLNFGSNISEKIDFMLSSNSSLNFVENSLQTSSNSQYLKQTVRFNVSVMPIGGLVLQTDLSDEYYSSFDGNSNQNYIYWNASIAYKFLKSKKLEARLSVYDILKQNQNLSRNITETYNEEVITNSLSQYVMLTLTWNFTTFKSGNPELPKAPEYMRQNPFR